MLWLALVLLAATFLAIRNVFGALAVLVTAGGVFAVSYYAPAAVQAGFAYLAAWFLLFGGLRPVVELARARGSASAVGAGFRRRPAGPADRRPGQRVDHAVYAGRAGRPGRRGRPARAARLAPRPEPPPAPNACTRPGVQGRT